MSIKLMNLAWEMELPLGQKMVLMALADRANTDGECWPGQDSLARMCSMSERALRDNLNRLQEAGLIEVLRQRKDGKYLLAVYHLNIGNPVSPPAESAGGNPVSPPAESAGGNPVSPPAESAGGNPVSPPADCDLTTGRLRQSPPADCDISRAVIYTRAEPTNNQPTREPKPSVASKSQPEEKITFDESERKLVIPMECYLRWEEVFPKLDLDAEIAKADLWLAANPKKRKKNYDRFLLGWFSRAAEKAKPVAFARPQQHQPRGGAP